MIESIENLYGGFLEITRKYTKTDDIDNLKGGEYAIYRNALATCYNDCDYIIYIHDENDRLVAVLHNSKSLVSQFIDAKIKEYGLKV